MQASAGLTGSMFVLTIDQIDSRSEGDAVPRLLTHLAELDTVLPFERTAGDEVQGVLADPDEAVRAWHAAARDQRWSVGLGLGHDVELGESSRASRGGPFLAARDAVEDAKGEDARVSVRATPEAPASAVRAAGDAQAVLRLLALVLRSRTAAGWRAVDAAEARPEATQEQLAADLGVSRQAVSKALRGAHVGESADGIVVAGRLLGRALEACGDGSVDRSGGNR